jgi:hypothetical protein
VLLCQYPLHRCGQEFSGGQEDQGRSGPAFPSGKEQARS